MSLTFDATRLTAKLAAAANAIQPMAEELLPGAALATVLGAGYIDPEEDEEGEIDLDALFTEVESTATLSYLVILQVYDWILDPEAHHCSSATGMDCPTIAKNGPYLATTFLVRPGDGTTPCGKLCHCQWLPRPLDLAVAAAEPMQEVGQAIRLRLARQWKGG